MSRAAQSKRNMHHRRVLAQQVRNEFGSRARIVRCGNTVPDRLPVRGLLAAVRWLALALLPKEQLSLSSQQRTEAGARAVAMGLYLLCRLT